MTTLEEAVQEDVKRSLSDWAMYFYRIGYEDAESKIVYCKDCKHRPRRSDVGDEHEGFNLEFPDEICPCQCEDHWYNWMPRDDWFCGNGERRTE